MFYEEFERMAGYEVNYLDYVNIIEPMYMSTDLSKEEFVKCLDKNRFALKTDKQLINEMKKIARVIKSKCLHESTLDDTDNLMNLCDEYINRFARGLARTTTRGYLMTGDSYITKIDLYHVATGEIVKTIELTD